MREPSKGASPGNSAHVNAADRQADTQAESDGPQSEESDNPTSWFKEPKKDPGAETRQITVDDIDFDQIIDITKSNADWLGLDEPTVPFDGLKANLPEVECTVYLTHAQLESLVKVTAYGMAADNVNFGVIEIECTKYRMSARSYERSKFAQYDLFCPQTPALGLDADQKVRVVVAHSALAEALDGTRGDVAIRIKPGAPIVEYQSRNFRRPLKREEHRQFISPDENEIGLTDPGSRGVFGRDRMRECIRLVKTYVHESSDTEAMGVLQAHGGALHGRTAAAAASMTLEDCENAEFAIRRDKIDDFEDLLARFGEDHCHFDLTPLFLIVHAGSAKLGIELANRSLEKLDALQPDFGEVQRLELATRQLQHALKILAATKDEHLRLDMHVIDTLEVECVLSTRASANRSVSIVLRGAIRTTEVGSAKSLIFPFDYFRAALVRRQTQNVHLDFSDDFRRVLICDFFTDNDLSEVSMRVGRADQNMAGSL